MIVVTNGLGSFLSPLLSCFQPQVLNRHSGTRQKPGGVEHVSSVVVPSKICRVLRGFLKIVVQLRLQPFCSLCSLRVFLLPTEVVQSINGLGEETVMWASWGTSCLMLFALEADAELFCY